MVHSANESSDPVQRTLIHFVGHSVSLSRILYLVLLTAAAPLRHIQNKKSKSVHVESRGRLVCSDVLGVFTCRHSEGFDKQH